MLSETEGFRSQVSGVRKGDVRYWHSCETSEEWIRFYFFRQDLQDWRDFFRLRRGVLSAEGRFIPMILSNFLLKMRIHSYFCRILIFVLLRFFFG